MLASLLLTAAAVTLGQADEGALSITNPRATYGQLGAIKTKNVGTLPGDIAHFSFDINNLKLDAAGKASYSVEIEVTDSTGAVAFHQKPHNAVAQNFFGGNTLQGSAHMEIPLDAKPGFYSWKVTIQDRLADKSVTAMGKGKVLKADFGLIRVATFADAENRVATPPLGTVGDTLYVSFAAIGFGRDPKTKQPDLKVKMRILDDKGQPTIAQPLTGHINKDIPDSLKILPLQFALLLNRPGRYTIELSARCEMCDKDSTVTLPVQIIKMD